MRVPDKEKNKKVALALRHVAFENLSAIEPVLATHGYNVRTIDAPTADLDDRLLEEADLLVVLGGPIGVYQQREFPFLTKEIQVVERRLARGAPTLGICLGCQIMASALGARVFPGHSKEIGWQAILGVGSSESPISELTRDDGTVLHWHGDTFDLPEGATRLARSDVYENEAFGYGRTGLAFQFHFEVTSSDLELWLVGHVNEISNIPHVSIPELRKGAARHARNVNKRGQLALARWLTQLPSLRSALLGGVPGEV